MMFKVIGILGYMIFFLKAFDFIFYPILLKFRWASFFCLEFWGYEIFEFDCL